MSDKISKYEIAPIAKRLFAGIMDAVVFLFVFFGMALWIFTPIADAAFGYQKSQDLGNRYFLASHLYVMQKTNDDGKIVSVEVKDSTGKFSDYQSAPLYSYTTEDTSFYIKRIYYYYHNFKTNTDIELPTNSKFDAIKDHFVSPEYNVKINGVLPVNYYTNDWFSKSILSIGNADSYFKIDTSITDYVSSISLKEGVKKEDALKYIKNQAYEATKDFYYSNYITEINNQIKGMQFFIFIPPFVLSYSIFFILIPMLMKDGETLGKKTMHISVISFDGYQAKKRQILFREILLLIVILILGVVVGIGLTSLAIISLGVVLLFIGTLIPKNKRSVFDYAAYTIVVDSIHSTWFKNEEDERRHKQEIDDNMSKYKKYIPENPNLIQVGSEIIDPELKKEVEKKNKKK